MTTYRITAINTKTEKTLDMGLTKTKAKMATFRTMQSYGDEIIELFDDCGDFEFRWENKVWSFYDEQGNNVGRISIEADKEAAYNAKLALYQEQVSAFEAQNSASSVEAENFKKGAYFRFITSDGKTDVTYMEFSKPLAEAISEAQKDFALFKKTTAPVVRVEHYETGKIIWRKS